MRKELHDLLRNMFANGEGKTVVMDGDSEKGVKLLEMLYEALKDSKPLKDSEPLECDCFKCKTVRSVDAYVLDGVKNRSIKYEEIKKRLETESGFKGAAKLCAKTAIKKIERDLKKVIDVYATTKMVIEMLKEQEDTKDESSTRDNK